MPMQYSTKSEVNLEDEHSNTKAHTQYLAMLVNHTPEPHISDEDAHVHVEERTWPPLTALYGPNVKFDTATGFGEDDATKCGIPIVSAALKIVNQKGKSTKCGIPVSYTHLTLPTICSV